MTIDTLLAARMGLAALGAVLATGCASIPPPPPPAAALAPTAGQEAGAEALDAWWTSFDDPVLVEIVDRALGESPDARVIAARLEAAEAARKETLAADRAQGALGLQTSRRRTDRVSGDAALLGAGVTAQAEASLPISWEVDFWGRRAARAAAASSDLAADRFSLEAGRALLAAQTVEIMMEIRAGEARLEEARAQAAIQGELVRLARARAELGLSPRADIAPLEATFATTEAIIAGLEAERDAARRALSGLLGAGRAPLPDLGALPNAPPKPPVLMEATLLARRPDVREAEARLAAAGQRQRLASAALLPTIVWAPTAGLSSVLEPGSAVGSFWAMGLSATLPVLDRPRLLAALGGETARRAEALALLERTVQTALAEADQGFMRLDAETLRAERLRAAESAAQRAFEAARRRYGAGLDDIDPVLAAERAWREARSQALEGRVSRISRTIDLFKALGGGWSPAAIQTQQGQPT